MRMLLPTRFFAVAAGGLAVLVQFTKGSLLRRTPVTILDEPLATTVFVISHQGSEKREKAFEKRVRVG